MRICLIRHGATRGNLERRYIGATDEGLCDEGRRALASREWPEVDLVATSPMTRCLETAQVIYPIHKPLIVPDFRECDFGALEGRSAEELSDDPAYQVWIDSGGELGFPGGEDPADFRARTVKAFDGLMRQVDVNSIAIIAHGGTFMAILARYGVPHRAYFDWHIPNGGLLACDWDGSAMRILAEGR